MCEPIHRKSGDLYCNVQRAAAVQHDELQLQSLVDILILLVPGTPE